jgi:hypothetical protein
MPKIHKHHIPQQRPSFEVKQQNVSSKIQKEAEKTHHVGQGMNPPKAMSVSPIITPVSKRRIESSGNNAQSAHLRHTFDFTNFIAGIFSTFRKALRYINIFAYFNKPKPPTAVAGSVEQVEATPQQLREAAQQLASFFRNNENLFEYEGIFRVSPRETRKKALYNELIHSPSHALSTIKENEKMNADDAYLVAVLFKELYRNMNIFGENKTIRKKFDTIAESLHNQTDQEKIITNLQDLINTLSTERKQDLQTFLEILLLANKQEATNKMKMLNLARMAGPNLMTLEGEDLLAKSQSMNHLALLLLENFRSLEF